MKRILIGLFSAGWIFPMGLAVHTYLDFMRVEVGPRLVGEQPVNSFPFLHFCQQTFTIGWVWLAAVILFWTWRVSKKTLLDA